MCPEPVITSSDAKASTKVVYDAEDRCLKSQLGPKSGHQPGERQADNQGSIEPIDVLVPILAGDGQIGDVWLFGVVGLVAVRLRDFGHWRRL